VSDELPCGIDIEADGLTEFDDINRHRVFYKLDNDYQELNKADTSRADWKVYFDEAEGFLKGNKHLWILTYFAKAALGSGGLEAFADAVALVRYWCENHWEHLHPVANDTSGKKQRINALGELSGNMLIFMLSKASLPGTIGATLKNYQGSRKDVSQIADYARQIFADSSREQVSQVEEVVASLVQDVQWILDHVDRTFSSDDDVNCGDFLSDMNDKLIPELNTIHLFYQQSDDSGESSAVATAGGVGESQNPAGAAVSVSGALTHSQIREMLDRICDNYKRYEPSSPVPLLLKRAKKLIGLSFLELVDFLS